MDQELREVLAEIRGDAKHGFERLEAKIDSAMTKIGTQEVMLTGHGYDIGSLKSRFTAHKEDHANSRKWWGGVVASVVILWIISVWDWIKNGGLKP